MEKLAVSIEELASMIGVGHTKAYELTRRKDFPSVRLGKRIIVPVDLLKAWFEKLAQEGSDE